MSRAVCQLEATARWAVTGIPIQVGDENQCLVFLLYHSNVFAQLTFGLL